LRPEEVETYLRVAGYRLIAGVDEAGRGSLAGPVVAAAVILPPACAIDGVDDSKALSAHRREQLDLAIRAEAVAVGFGVILNCLQKVKAQLSYVTTGQDVPSDIEVGEGRVIAGLILGKRKIQTGLQPVGAT